MKRLIALGLFLLALPAHAELTPQQRLNSTTQQLNQSQSRTSELQAQQTAIDNELQGLRSKLVSAAGSADRTEKELSELENSLADLEGTAARRSVTLAAQRQQLSETLALLQRLALTPPAAQLFNATPPLDRLRSDLQLKALLPEIEKRRSDLAATVADMRLLQKRLEEKRRTILAERRSLNRQQTELNRLMDERTRRLASTRSLHTREIQRAERLAGEAQNLRDLLERMEREQKAERAAAAAAAAATTAIAPSAPSTLRALPTGAAKRLPVSAPALLRFGERDEFGNTSKGITLRPRAGVVATAVAAGRVAFAGPFRGYGRVLILEHAGGYHTVLAGLGRVTVGVGQRIAASEPLGTVSQQEEPAPELYFEVRHNGAPVDPLGNNAMRLTEAAAQ